jgi:hypothetical protein
MRIIKVGCVKDEPGLKVTKPTDALLYLETIRNAEQEHFVALSLNEEKAQEIIGLLNGLNDYPCIDDEDMSNMEYDAFLESLDSFDIRECNDLLASMYLVEVDDYNEKKLKDVLIESDSHDNPSWFIESGGICYIDIKKLCSHVTLSDYYSCLIDFALKGDI